MVTKQKSNQRYDQRITIGDQIFAQEKASERKLAPKWLGSYAVIEIHLESPNVTILNRNKPVNLHRNLLKRFSS